MGWQDEVAGREGGADGVDGVDGAGGVGGCSGGTMGEGSAVSPRTYAMDGRVVTWLVDGWAVAGAAGDTQEAVDCVTGCSLVRFRARSCGGEYATRWVRARTLPLLWTVSSTRSSSRRRSSRVCVVVAAARVGRESWLGGFSRSAGREMAWDDRDVGGVREESERCLAAEAAVGFVTLLDGKRCFLVRLSCWRGSRPPLEPIAKGPVTAGSMAPLKINYEYL